MRKRAPAESARRTDETAGRNRSATEAAKGQPTCLLPFAVEVVRDAQSPLPIFVDYRVRCGGCGEEGFQILSRPVIVPDPSPYYGLEPGETHVRPPHDLRCAACGKTDVVFDPRRHGYDGALGHPPSYECGDVEGEPSPGVYRVTVSLGFNIDWDELSEIAREYDVPPYDLFDVISLRGDPVVGEELLSFDYECA